MATPTIPGPAPAEGPPVFGDVALEDAETGAGSVCWGTNGTEVPHLGLLGTPFLQIEIFCKWQKHSNTGYLKMHTTVWFARNATLRTFVARFYTNVISVFASVL